MEPEPEKAKRGIKSISELETLKEQRNFDHERLTLEHPAPSWAPGIDVASRQIRMRERRIRLLENRLERTKQSFEKSFDQAV